MVRRRRCACTTSPWSHVPLGSKNNTAVHLPAQPSPVQPNPALYPPLLMCSEHTIEENILKKSDQKRQLDWLAIQVGGLCEVGVVALFRGVEG